MKGCIDRTRHRCMLFLAWVLDGSLKKKQQIKTEWSHKLAHLSRNASRNNKIETDEYVLRYKTIFSYEDFKQKN